jgi:hypothetical protein
MKKLFFVLILILLVMSCDGRKSGKDRIEKNANIILPEDFSVLKDEYQDTQHNCIYYELRFTKQSAGQLIKTIKSSSYYVDNIIPADTLIPIHINPIWCDVFSGFYFSKIDGKAEYDISFDTLTNVLKYQECADERSDLK